MKTQPTKTGDAAESEAPATLSAGPDSDAVRKYFAVIAAQPYFKGLSIRQTKVLAKSAVESEVAVDETIFEEGDQANRFYIILEGKVQIEIETPDRGRIPVQILGPGDDLGWSWMFAPYHTQFGARALTRTRMLLFYAPHIRQQCESDCDFGYELMKRVASVMLDRLQALRRKLSEAAMSNSGSR